MESVFGTKPTQHHDVALLVMRIGYAALMLGLHGGARFIRALEYVFDGPPWAFVDLVSGLGFPFASAFAVVSAMSESVCVLLVALGAWTRIAAAVVAIDMIVAIYNEASKGDPVELPALYLLGALVLVVGGAGRYSVDGFRHSRPALKPDTTYETTSG